MSKSLNQEIDAAICEIANAKDGLQRARVGMHEASQREALAANKLREAQQKFDKLAEQVRQQGADREVGWG